MSKKQLTPEERQKANIRAAKRMYLRRFEEQATFLDGQFGPLGILIGDYEPPETVNWEACYDAGWTRSHLLAHLIEREALRELEEDGLIVEVWREPGMTSGEKILASYLDEWKDYDAQRKARGW